MVGLPSGLKGLAQPAVFAKGAHLYHVQQSIRQCYYIVSGMVKVYVDHPNGKRSVLDFFGVGDWLGDLSIFIQEDSVKENEALEQVHCLVFDLDTLKVQCKKSADIALYFATYMASKLQARSYRMSEYMNYSLDQKLAQFILRYQNNGVYSIAHTHACEYLNVSYRHVLYVMKRFCDQGILKKEKNYTIINPAQLAALGGFEDGQSKR